jgi:putative two-component system response regulator
MGDDVNVSAGPDLAKCVLVVDDEPGVRDLITRWLTAEGYCCHDADSAQAAWNYLQNHKVQLVTLDITMPGRSGRELLGQISQHHPDTAVMMISASQDARTAVETIKQGAHAYLVKPIRREQLVFQARKTLAQRRALVEKREYTRRLERQVHAQTIAIHRAHEETIHRLVAASACRDVETGSHIRRIGILAELIAKAAGWPADRAAQIRLAAPMHDVGKIGIPDAILRKPARLTAEEFQIMKSHTIIGAKMLAGSDVPMLQMAQQIALCHHEQWGGGGYPAGLAAAAIPEFARITAIADVYDSLSHPRVYRPAFAESEVLAILRGGAGVQWDPQLLAVFFQRFAECRRILAENPDEPLDDLTAERLTHGQVRGADSGPVLAATS